MALVRGSKNVEDYHKQTQTQFLIQSPEQSDLLVDKNVACLKDVLFERTFTFCIMALVRGSKNVEDYHKLTQIQFLIQSLEQSDVRGDKHSF
jgi:hypothetical protein